MSLSLYEFSQSIAKLNKEKKFGDSLKYFKDNKVQFTSEQIVSNDYLIFAMLTALRQTGNFDNAFKFLKLYKITIDENTKEIILTAYGWLLYSKFKAENQLNENYQIESEIIDDEEIETATNYHYNKTEIIQKIESFLPLILNVNNEYAYSVVSNLFTSVIKAEKKKPKVNWKLVSEICDLIPPDQLHTDCRTIEVEIKGQRKSKELASDKENWYAYKSKALMKLGLFQECYELSKKAIETFQKFHYSNDVWFARRVAISKKQLGDPESAISELQQILKRKREWFIEKELAELYKEKGDIKNAFKLAIEAINNFGDLEYKVDLLFLLGELLKAKGQDDLAFKHLSLSRLIRIDEEWNNPPKLSSALGQFGKENIPVEKLQELQNELRKYWNSFKPQQNDTRQNTDQCLLGKIDKILNDNEKGINGFIKYDGNKSVYFAVSSNYKIKEVLKIGTEVKFKILSATEEKKERAVEINQK